MKKIQILILLQFITFLAYSLNVTIISSQANQTGADMDSVWYQVVVNMGHKPEIVPQSTLESNLFFSKTDILIISNAVIGLDSIAVNNIIQFIKSGKSVYLQSEYLPYYTTNLAFAYIINSLGGSFKWGKLYDGNLKMNVLGSYGNTKQSVDTILCWFSVSGLGDCNTINILEYDGKFHGWQYIPRNPSYGSIISIADQDWIWQRRSLSLMQNIITSLISPPPIPSANKLNIGYDTTICKGESLILDATSLNGTYLWNDNSTTPTYTVKDKGVFWVMVNLSCGILSDSIVVETKHCDCFVYTPNVFKPNSAYGNNQFNIQSKCHFDEFSLLIFNRWGELVFESNDELKSWDGTYHGNISQEGAYTFLLKYKIIDDLPCQRYGVFTLIR